MSFVYVASPYSHSDPTVREERYQLTMRYCAHALWREHYVYSPIVHCHEMARLYGLPKDAKFWERYNQTMLRCAKSMEVLMLPGWTESLGINGEITFAKKLSLPIHHIKSDHEWLTDELIALV